MREWMTLIEGLTTDVVSAIDEKKKKHHHHHDDGRVHGWMRGIYACPNCSSHIPSQHVGDHCPVCNAPVVAAGGSPSSGGNGGGGVSAPAGGGGAPAA